MNIKEVFCLSFLWFIITLVYTISFIKTRKDRKPPEYCILFEDIEKYVDFVNEKYKGLFYIQLTRVVGIGGECCQLTFHSYEYNAYIRCCPFYSLRNQYNKRYYYINTNSLLIIDDLINYAIKFFDSLKDYKYGVERRYYKLNNNDYEIK